MNAVATMGIITHISDQYDQQQDVQRIFVVTRFAPSNRGTLNRVASRASVMTGAGQRTLVVSAFDELGIDMVWREGPFARVDPTEKWPDAKKIDFHIQEIDSPSTVGDVFQLPGQKLPRGRIRDFISAGLDVFGPGERVLMMWEIPYEVGGRDF